MKQHNGTTYITLDIIALISIATTFILRTGSLLPWLVTIAGSWRWEGSVPAIILSPMIISHVLAYVYLMLLIRERCHSSYYKQYQKFSGLRLVGVSTMIICGLVVGLGIFMPFGYGVKEFSHIIATYWVIWFIGGWILLLGLDIGEIVGFSKRKA